MGPNLTSSGVHSIRLDELRDLIKNGKKYIAQIEQLREQEEKTREAIADLTKAKDLDKALQDAKYAEQSAREAASQAKEKAKEVVREAELIAQQRTDVTEELLQAMKIELNAKHDEMRGLLAQSDLLSQEVQQAKAAKDSINQQIQTLREQANQLNAQIDKKRKSLEQLLTA